MASLDELAAAYLKHYRTKKDEDFWAFDEVLDLLFNSPNQSWELTKKLVAACETYPELAYVAAGPLEDLLCCQHGPELIGRVELEADGSDRMQVALTGVWMDPECAVYARFRDLLKKYGFADGTRAGLETPASNEALPRDMK